MTTEKVLKERFNLPPPPDAEVISLLILSEPKPPERISRKTRALKFKMNIDPNVGFIQGMAVWERTFFFLHTKYNKIEKKNCEMISSVFKLPLKKIP